MHFRNDPSRPLTFILYWICWQIGSGSPTPFHILSTALHALTAILTMGFIATVMERATGRRAWEAAALAALAFVTSPLMAGTVIYAYGLSDVLCLGLTLAALWPLVRERPPSAIVIGGSVVCFALALGAKQSAIVLPGILVLVDLFSLKWRPRHYLIFGAIAGLYLCARVGYFGGIGDLEGRDQVVPLALYAPTQGWIILRYLAATLVPAGLTIDHRILPEDLSDLTKVFGWVVVLALSMAAAGTLRKGTAAAFKLVALGWSIFLLTLLPTSSVFPTVDLMVERRAYAADLGIFLILALAIFSIARLAPRITYSLVAVLIGAQAYAVVNRIEVYASPEKLWHEALERDPENPRAALNLAVFYSAEQRWAESRALLESLIRGQPNNGALYSKLAYIFGQPGYPERSDDLAWQNYQTALRLMPENVYANYNVGTWLMARGRHAEAEDYFRRTTRLNPQMAMAHLAAGEAALAQGNRDAAKSDFTRALDLDPTLTDARRLLDNLGH